MLHISCAQHSAPHFVCELRCLVHPYLGKHNICFGGAFVNDAAKVAPLLTNAFAYLVMGRMVYNFTAQAKIFGVKAWRFTLYFVLLDAT